MRNSNVSEIYLKLQGCEAKCADFEIFRLLSSCSAELAEQGAKSNFTPS